MNVAIAYRVWDAPVRVFHWLVTLLVLAQWASGEWNLWSMDWHFYVGYAMLGLILWRVLWGFFGSENARFAHFLVGPKRVLSYLPTLGVRAPDAHAGHNPLGGWAVIVLLLALAAQTITGLFSSDDIFLFGPLAATVSTATVDLMSGWHKSLTDGLVILIALHLVAVFWHLLWKRENLITPMVTGRRPFATDPQVRMVGWWRALLLALLSAGAVYALVAWGQS